MSRKAKVLWLLLMLAGLVVLAYPAFSDYLNRINGSWAITQAQEAMEKAEPEELQYQRNLAQQYNSALLEGREPEDYGKILDFGDGVMGYVQIPSIGIKLPIYHGVEETTLQKGVGHLPISAFPIGGTGNHAVLTGHTGLPDAKLFTDLTQLNEKDLFYIHILAQSLAYEIDSIQVVLPSETAALQPIADKDYCTLVTCTPYGINSHRLLVRGQRVQKVQMQEESPAVSEEIRVPLSVGLIAAMAAAAALIGCIVWVLVRKEE